jgi:hypothetical protein
MIDGDLARVGCVPQLQQDEHHHAGAHQHDVGDGRRVLRASQLGALLLDVLRELIDRGEESHRVVAA